MTIHELVARITKNYSRFADHSAGKVHVFNTLARFACYCEREGTVVSASFNAEINPALTDYKIVPAVITVSCADPKNWTECEWTVIEQSKEAFEKYGVNV